MYYDEQDREMMQTIAFDHSMNEDFHLMFYNRNVHEYEYRDCYTLDEVATILRMSVLTIRQYVRTGKLKAIRKWRNWMVSGQQIARFIYERETGRKIIDGEPVLVIVPLNVYRDEGVFDYFEFASMQDILPIYRLQGMDHFFQTRKQLLKEEWYWVESITNLNGFFYRTHLLPRKVTSDKDLFGQSIPVNNQVIEDLIHNASSYMEEDTVEEARVRVKQIFGIKEVTDEVLVIYKTLLSVSASLSSSTANRLIAEAELRDMKAKKHEIHQGGD